MFTLISLLLGVTHRMFYLDLVAVRRDTQDVYLDFVAVRCDTQDVLP